MGLTVTENKNIKVQKGQILFTQGEECNSINFLMEGEIEILITNEVDIIGNTEDEVVAKSKRVCKLQENTFFGIDALFSGQPYNYSIKALTDCTISVYPADKLKVRSLIASKINYGFLMARSLVKLQQKSLMKIKGMDAFIKDIQRIQDALALVYAELSKSYDIKSKSALTSFSQDLYSRFKNAKGSLPIPLTSKILKTSFEKFLEKKYGFENNLETRKLSFLYKFFTSPSELQMRLFQHDNFLLIYLAEELSDEISNVMGEIERAYGAFKQEFKHFIDEKENWMKEYAKILDNARKKKNQSDVALISEILKYLINMVINVENKFYNEFNFKISAPDKIIESIKAKLLQKEGDVEGEDIEVIDTPSSLPEECKDSATKILDYSEIDSETRKILIKSLANFKRCEDKLSDASEIRKLRKALSVNYWKLYEKVYTKAYKTGEMSRLVEVFLNYGMLDETLIKPRHVNGIWNFKDKATSKYSIYYTTEWLEKIYRKEQEPSITELGQTFYEIVRQNNKDKMHGRKITDIPEDLNTGEDRLLFEIRNMITSTVKITNGNIRSALPILIDEQIWREIDTLRVTRPKLEKVIDDILERDFSAFHRQVLYKNSERKIFKEFIMKQVIPNFIIVPSAGLNIMAYQVIDGRNKSSQGRIVLPALAAEPQNTSQYDDLFLLMLRSIAVFRWELVKEILGPAWTDVTESSLTSGYMDYIQFFKKNPKLSPETKEKLHIEFKKFRQDRDKFVNDYTQWAINEYDGQMKLNAVAREIFFKHVPFVKEMREKMGNQPRYQDIFFRFKNIRRKKMKTIQNHYFKYTKNGDILPQELEDNLKFYET